MARFNSGKPFQRTASIQGVSRETRKEIDELSCLESAGFAPDFLSSLRQRAATLALSPAHHAISEGLIDEEVSYKALAAQTGAEFTRVARDIARTHDWRAALRTGSIRLQDGRWLMAPQGKALATFATRLARKPRRDILVTSPAQFRASIETRFAREMAEHAVSHLSRKHPGRSAREGVGPVQKYALASIAALTCFGLLDGGLVWALCCALFSAAMAFGVVLRFASSFHAIARPAANAPTVPENALPDYTVLVPLYRESNIVAELVRNLRALDYPVARLEILLLVESDDTQTREAIERLPLPPHIRTLVMPPGFPRTKPRALNVGLAQARGDCIVVYDAEDRPEPDQLRKAAAAFMAGPPHLACLQASLAIENSKDSWLTRLFAIDYAGHFDVLMQGLSRMGLPMPLGGTSNHFRTQALRDIGGWDAWNVTEDADLGLRLARAGLSCRMLASTTWEEAPPTLADWLPQRRRWMKGWMQTLLTHTRKPALLWRELGALRAAHVLAMLVANAFGPMVGIWFTIYVLWHAFIGDLFDAQDWTTWIANFCWTSLAVTGFLSIIIPSLMGIARRGLWSSLPYLLLRAAHWFLLSLACAQALVELFRNPWHWAKTRHGLNKARAQDPA